MSEELWYPAFGLKSNPFQYYDFHNEMMFAECVPYIPTRATKFITELAESGVTCGIFGDRGVGKSTMLCRAFLNIKERKKIPHEALHCFLSPSSTLNFYDQLFDKSLGVCCPRRPDKIELHNMSKLEDIFERTLDKSWFELGYRKGDRADYVRDLVSHIYCRYPQCYRRAPRCEISLSNNSKAGFGVEKWFDSKMFLNTLKGVNHYCPLQVYITKKLLAEKGIPDENFQPQVFLVDLPDDLARAEEFMSLVRSMQRTGAVILIGTREHRRRLEKFDLFARFPHQEFPLMTNEELKQVYHARINWRQKKGYPSPFTEEAIDHVVKRSVRNPRTMIQTFESVLIDAKIEGITEPIGLDFVQESEFMPRLTVDDAVKRLVEKYVDMEKGWVPLEQSCHDMNELFNISITPRSLGRKLTALMNKGGPPIDRRHAPNSQYRYTGNDK